jgi:hypothetical protein
VLILKRCLVIGFMLTLGVGLANAQTSTPVPATGQAGAEIHVPVSEQAVASDAMGRPALSARLKTRELHGSQDSPVTNVLIVVTNSSPFFYNYVSGWVTFYDADGVRCGEGLFKLSALAPGESAETETPGLRLRCSPSTWRIVATNLLTPSGETARPAEPGAIGGNALSASPGLADPVPPLVLKIDGEELPIQIGRPVVIKVGGRDITLVLRTAR